MNKKLLITFIVIFAMQSSTYTAIKSPFFLNLDSLHEERSDSDQEEAPQSEPTLYVIPLICLPENDSYSYQEETPERRDSNNDEIETLIGFSFPQEEIIYCFCLERTHCGIFTHFQCHTSHGRIVPLKGFIY